MAELSQKKDSELARTNPISNHPPMSKLALSLPALLTLFAIVGAYYAFLGIVGPDAGVYSNVTRVEGLLGLIVVTVAVSGLHRGRE